MGFFMLGGRPQPQPSQDTTPPGAINQTLAHVIESASGSVTGSASTVAKVGSFTLNTATGAQAVTGVGFQPKGIIFLGSNISGNGNAAHIHQSLGFGSGSSARWAVAAKSDDAVTTESKDNYYFSTAKILAGMTTGHTTMDYVADLTSLDADGFTINLSTAPASGSTVYYLAIGGSAVSCKADKIDLAATYSNQSFTGVGFQPQAMLFGTSINNTTEGLVDVYNFTSGLGCATSSSARWTSTFFANWYDPPTNTSSYQRTNRCIDRAVIGDNPVAADLVSFDADGLTIGMARGDQAIRVGYFAMRAGNVIAGNFTQRSGTGSQAVTGLGFTPKALMLVSVGKVASTSEVDHAGRSVGFSDGTSTGCVSGATEDGNATASNSSSRSRNDKIISIITPGGASPTVVAEAGLTSLDSDGFTLNWTTADSTAREVLYFALG